MLAFPMQPALLGGAHYKKKEKPKNTRVFLKVTLVVVFLFILVNLVNDTLNLQWYKDQNRMLMASPSDSTATKIKTRDHEIHRQEIAATTSQSRRRGLRDSHSFQRKGNTTMDRSDASTSTTASTTTTNNNNDHRLEGQPKIDNHDNDEWVCSQWEESLDDFWQAHPHYEPIMDNETHTCFAPIQDPARVDFLCKLYQLQFPATNHHLKDIDDNSTTSTYSSTSSQGGASVDYSSVDDFVDELVTKLGEEVYASFRQQRPFQIHRQIADMNCDTTSHKKDPFCLFLPISNCTTTMTVEQQQEEEQSHDVSSPDGKPTTRKRNKKDPLLMMDQTSDDERASTMEQQQRRWIMDYLLRPRQHVRRQVYKSIQEQSPELTTLLGPSSSSCTWLHVRGKAVIPSSTLGFLSDTPLFGKR